MFNLFTFLQKGKGKEKGDRSVEKLSPPEKRLQPSSPPGDEVDTCGGSSAPPPKIEQIIQSLAQDIALESAVLLHNPWMLTSSRSKISK